jgi:hypothetical protein
MLADHLQQAQWAQASAGPVAGKHERRLQRRSAMLLDSRQQCIQQAIQHKRAYDDVNIATLQMQFGSAAEERCGFIMQQS